MNDKRNVLDEFKDKSHEAIVAELDKRGVNLHIAIENLERDFNMGTIVRSANAFGVRHVHVIGRRQWNKRGAMMTDKYLTVHYYDSVNGFYEQMQAIKRLVIAVDNTPGATAIVDTKLPVNAVLVFGSEKSGISAELLMRADQHIKIEQFGSTRSLNVGVAAGIAMYMWLYKNVLQIYNG